MWIIYIPNDIELYRRLMYMSTSKYNKVVEGVMRDNLNDFRIDVNRPTQEYIRTNNKDAQSYSLIPEVKHQEKL